MTPLEFRRKRRFIRFVRAFRRNLKLHQEFPHIPLIYLSPQPTWRGATADKNKWLRES